MVISATIARSASVMSPPWPLRDFLGFARRFNFDVFGYLFGNILRLTELDLNFRSGFGSDNRADGHAALWPGDGCLAAALASLEGEWLIMQQALAVAIDAAHAAGRAIRDLYGRDIAIRQKGEAGPVTEADLASDACIHRILRQAYPDDGWVSEETADRPDRLAKSRVWIVDPLDGTWEFTTGVPEFVVSIALSVEGVAVLGVLYNPITEETFCGLRGEGAWLNGVPMAVSSTADLASSTFCVSRTESGRGLLKGLEARLNLQPRGSVAYKCGLVAAGRYEGVFTCNPRNEWDICAGVAIIEAAGGRVTDRQGEPYRFNQRDPLKRPLAGTNTHVHAALMAVLAEAGAGPR
jgi:myo-inositol-1(or 4)-monophosphatase